MKFNCSSCLPFPFTGFFKMPPNKYAAKLNSEVEKCILNLEKCFKQELKQQSPVFGYDRIVRRISHALNLNERAIYRVLEKQKEKKTAHPTRKREHYKKKGPAAKLDDFGLCLLRRKVYEFYAKGEFASIKRITKRMRDSGYPVSTSTVWRALVKAGFKFHRKLGRRFLKESNDVVAARHSYLRNIKKYRQQGYEIVYLDETWVNSHHNAPGEWTQNKKGPIGVLYPEHSQSSRFLPSGKGTRLIVLDAGSSQTGFIPEVGLVFTSKTNSGDYHDEMNAKHFLEWFEHTLIPAIDGPAVIVLDNAPYHNTKTVGSYFPSRNANKTEIKRWLEEKGVAVDGDETKAELLMTVRNKKPEQVFETDEIANRNGHLVLRLPVRHCELNPIELIQAQEKQKIAQRNCTFKLKDVKRLLEEAKAEITADDWRRAEDHVKAKVEQPLWELDGVREEEVDQCVIHIGDDDISEDEGIEYENEEEEEEEQQEAVAMETVVACPPAEPTTSACIGPAGDMVYDDTICKLCGFSQPPASVKVTGKSKKVTGKSKKGEDLPWVECTFCESWVHLECSVGKIDLNTVSEQDCFACKLCQAILKKKY